MHALIVVASFALAGCSSGTAKSGSVANSARPDGKQVIHMDGYPLDATLAAMASFPDTTTAVLVSNVKLGRSFWTTPDGSVPAYIAENRAPGENENYMIMTEFTAAVDETLLADANGKKSNLQGRVIGGTVGDVVYEAGGEIAPALNTMKGKLLLAGKFDDGVFVPIFVYSVDGKGRAKSLKESGSTEPAEFDIARAKDVLASKTK